MVTNTRNTNTGNANTRNANKRNANMNMKYKDEKCKYNHKYRKSFLERWLYTTDDVADDHNQA